MTVDAGIADLVVMKTSKSAFSGFPRDEYTTLAETEDRLLATKVIGGVALRLDGVSVDYDDSFEAVSRTLLDVFAEHFSVSVQASIWIIGQAIVERHPEVAEITMTLPNLHHWLVDLEPVRDRRTTARCTSRRPSRTDSSRRPSGGPERVEGRPPVAMRVAGIFRGPRVTRFDRDTLAVTGRAQDPGHGSANCPAPDPREVSVEPTGSSSTAWSSATRPSPSILAERAPEDRPALVERALRIGLLALQDAGATVNVDVVRTEFEKLMRQTEQVNTRAAEALDQTLRQNFADGDGRLPRTLERFLGDRGALRAFVERAVRRDEARQRDRPDADAARHVLRRRRVAARASCSTPPASTPRCTSSGSRSRRQFDRLNERLTAIEAAAAARGAERARSAAKGADFEDLLEAMLADFARGAGDLLDRTGSARRAARSAPRRATSSLTIDPARTGGADVRIVIEAKDRAMSGRAIREELREAKENRAAAVAVAVFGPDHAPAGIAPFDVRAGDVYCVIDPANPDPATLDAAIRLARLLAIASLRDAALGDRRRGDPGGPGGDPRRARGAQGHQGDPHVDREGRGRGPGLARRDSATRSSPASPRPRRRSGGPPRAERRSAAKRSGGGWVRYGRDW